MRNALSIFTASIDGKQDFLKTRDVGAWFTLKHLLHDASSMEDSEIVQVLFAQRGVVPTINGHVSSSNSESSPKRRDMVRFSYSSDSSEVHDDSSEELIGASKIAYYESVTTLSVCSSSESSSALSGEKENDSPSDEQTGSI